MNIFKRFASAFRAAYRSTLSFSEPLRDPVLRAAFGMERASSGVEVNEWSALNYSGFWAAVHLISGHLGALPLALFQRSADGRSRERADGHPCYRLMHDDFNEYMSAAIGRRTLVAHMLTWGNGYAEIERSNAGRPLALWPLAPSQVTPRWEKRPGSAGGYTVRYEVRGQKTLEYMDVLHLSGLSFDGLQGYSVVRKAREGIGLGLATEKFGATFFGNGARPGIALKHQKTLSAPAQERLKASFYAEHGGPDKAHGVHVLEEGLDLQTYSIPNDDAQFLETRKFNIEEMARWFNLPPHKLAHLERSTNNNIEHQAIEYLTDCLYPRIVTVEQEYSRKLLTPDERGRYYAEFIVDGLLRGDIKTRYEAYAIGRQWGWLCADDVLERENQNPLPNGAGQIFLAPSNMTTPEKLAAAPPPGLTAAKPAPSAPARALRGLLLDTIVRLIRKEANGARRAAAKGAPAFTAWMDEFYSVHEAQLADVLAPVAGDRAKRMAREHVEMSRNGLQEARTKDLEADVDRIVSRWETERPAALADVVLEDEDDLSKAS